jgi:hypothetical protein
MLLLLIALPARGGYDDAPVTFEYVSFEAERDAVWQLDCDGSSGHDATTLFQAYSMEHGGHSAGWYGKPSNDLRLGVKVDRSGFETTIAQTEDIYPGPLDLEEEARAGDAVRVVWVSWGDTITCRFLLDGVEIVPTQGNPSRAKFFAPTEMGSGIAIEAALASAGVLLRQQYRTSEYSFSLMYGIAGHVRIDGPNWWDDDASSFPDTFPTAVAASDSVGLWEFHADRVANPVAGSPVLWVVQVP